MSGYGSYNKRPKRKAIPYDPTIPLTDEKRAKLKQTARNSALWYLGRSDKTRKELEDRLKRKVYLPPEVIQEVLDELEAVKYIDDARFAENFTRSSTQYRSLGSQAISMELRRKGVDAEIISEAVAEIDPEEEAETARDLVRRKLRNAKMEEADKVRNRLVGMLARKGFGMGVAFQIVKEEMAIKSEALALEEDEDMPDEA